MNVPAELLWMAAGVATLTQLFRPLKVPGAYLPFIALGLAAVFIGFTHPPTGLEFIKGLLAVGLTAAGGASAAGSLGKLKNVGG